MSALAHTHDIAGSLAPPPFGQALDMGLRLLALNLRHRLLVQLQPENEILDRGDAGVDRADRSVRLQSVQRGDNPLCDRAEPLLTTADQLCSFSHSVPQSSPAPMCGIEQRTSQRSGSSADRVILANTALYSQTARLQHSTRSAARSKISHTISRATSAVPTAHARIAARAPSPVALAAPIHSTA